MSQSTGGSFSTRVALTEKSEPGWTELVLSSRRLLNLVLMLVIFSLASRPIIDPDFWWHLRTGQYILQTRTIPHTDIFSVTHLGQSWITHEWLSEILIASIHGLLGYGGLILLFSLVVTATFWITYKRIPSCVGHPFVAGFALILGALASAPTWGVRPQMFTLLFASIFIAVLDSYARDGNRSQLFWLIPLTALWVNMHAGFAVGLALIFLMMVGIALEGLFDAKTKWDSAWRNLYPLGIVWSLCLAAVFFNPNGARMYLYPFETLKSHAMMKYINEWWSPNFHEQMFQPLAFLIFAVFGSLILSKKRVELRDLIFLSATGWAALRSARNIPFFVLIAIPLLAEHSWHWITSYGWAQSLTRPEKRELGANAILKMVLNAALLIALPLGVAGMRLGQSVTKQSAVSGRYYPVAAVDFIVSEKPPQPIYNEYGWGGYIIWRLYPDYRVYIDGRADVYGDTFLEDCLKTYAGEGRWQDPLDEHGIQTVVVRSDSPLANLLRQTSGWKKIFDDSQAVVFTRR